jgi:misacylated tRNA(Ala) deacylase
MATKIVSNIPRSGISTVVGILACQNDSYLKTLTTSVVACTKTPPPSKKDRAASDWTGYEVEFEDTVLFPEGGGQPYDTGVAIVNGKEIKVKNVQRDGLTAVHLVDEEIPQNSRVELKVDWKRRLDHMQQHTGQHLLSAVLDKRNLETLAWNLGQKVCYIELPRKLSDEEVAEVQQEVNEEIFKNRPVEVEHPEQEKHDTVDHKVPENYDLAKGVLRVIHIDGLDANPCCGTHLKSTGEIGALALLHSLPIRGTNSRLFFVAGDRVAKYAADMNIVVRKANALLSCQTEEVEDKISRLSIQVKDLVSREKSWQSQVARFEAAQIIRDLEEKKLAILHKPEGTMDYLRVVEKELGKVEPGQGTLVLLSGIGKAGGSIVISGDKTDEIAGKVKEIITNVKGGGKGKWQGKVPAWEKGAIEGVLALKLD